MFGNSLFVRRVYQADAARISFVLFLFLPPCPLWPARDRKIKMIFFAVLCSNKHPFWFQLSLHKGIQHPWNLVYCE